MCHAWITHWAVTRAPLTMPRRRSTRDECTHGRNAREPFLAHTRASYISNQAFLTHTGNITYDDHVLDSLNEIPPTARVV